jgi:hypothetical protein
MKTFWKRLVAGGAGLAALGVSAAMADHRPEPCDRDHDHRSHAANYYNYYPTDRYYRAGPYRESGVSFSVTFGDSDPYDRPDRFDRRDHDGFDRYDHGLRHGYRGREARILKHRTFDGWGRSRIVLTEEVVRTREGPRIICTVSASGPHARHVSALSLRRIANANCSRRAEIRILA